MQYMQYLYYYLPMLEAVRDFLELGGVVLLLIAVLTLVMWGLIFDRLLYLRTGHGRLFRKALDIWESRPERKSWHAHRIREQMISIISQQLERNLALIASCVALCPLMGLLGTVTGMIEVFEVMAISGTGNPRSMAAGVSKATVPTMAGMVSALSGLGMSAYLQRTAASKREQLAEQMTMDH